MYKNQRAIFLTFDFCIVYCILTQTRLVWPQTSMNTEPLAAKPRPPIVVVLGHVDHGKSTLLDFIRKANTVAREAGGITQHVAAYEVVHPYEGEDRRITFIDTPGHAAFQAIRARGASVADIAILVVAADDGVKAQTLEALTAIKDAGIPFIVAINKIDKPNADLARTQNSLLEHGVYLETLGGDVPWAAISAKVGTGVPQLLDLILLVAELHDFRAMTETPAHGYVIEAHLDQKRGIAATLIIREGSIESGMTVVAGDVLAPVRIMENFAGKTISRAGPSMPATLVGFDSLPDAGAEFVAHSSKREAEGDRSKNVSLVRSTVQTEESNEGDKFFLPIIIRADTAGSLEAIAAETAKIGDQFRGVSIVQSGIGDISEGDVKAAIAAGTLVVFGFNAKLDANAAVLARQHGILFENYSIIYELTARLQELLKKNAPKHTKERLLGSAKILKVFSSRKDEHLIGGRVRSGVINAKESVHLVRAGARVGTGEIISMQSGRKQVQEIGEGGEFGAQVEFTEKPNEGDTLECVAIDEI